MKIPIIITIKNNKTNKHTLPSLCAFIHHKAGALNCRAEDLVWCSYFDLPVIS